MPFEPKGRRIVDVPRMQRPWRFALRSAAILIVAGALLYRFGLPLLEDGSVWCPRVARRTLSGGCLSHFGEFAIVWLVAVALAESLLWRKCR